MKNKRKIENKRAQRYNWELLKQQYFADTEISVIGFLRCQMGDENLKYSGTIDRHCKGWYVEKQEWLKGITKRVKEELGNEFTDLMKKMKRDGLEAIYLKFQRAQVRDSDDGKVVDVALEIKDLERMINLAKTEAGEPTKVYKSNNVHKVIKVSDIVDKLKEEIPDAFPDAPKI